MAQAPMLAPTAPPAGGMMGGDPMAGAAPDADTAGGKEVVCTICGDGQGGYVVYAGDEAEDGADGTDAGMSDDNMDAMGPAGAAPIPDGGVPAPEGAPAPNKGAALKLALDIMTAHEASSGAPSAEDSFSAGFGTSKAPSPGIAQKY